MDSLQEATRKVLAAMYTPESALRAVREGDLSLLEPYQVRLEPPGSDEQ